MSALPWNSPGPFVCHCSDCDAPPEPACVICAADDVPLDDELRCEMCRPGEEETCEDYEARVRGIRGTK